jgi:hypothetical protein
MQDTLTVHLPTEIKAALDEWTRSEGISSDEFIARAIQQYLALRQFRSLRERMLQHAQSQGFVPTKTSSIASHEDSRPASSQGANREAADRRPRCIFYLMPGRASRYATSGLVAVHFPTALTENLPE